MGADGQYPIPSTRSSPGTVALVQALLARSVASQSQIALLLQDMFGFIDAHGRPQRPIAK